MKLLVTGGAGFIGSNFIRYWLKKNPNDKIINLDKLTYAGHLSSTRDFSNSKKYKFVKGDICDRNLVFKVTKGIDLVVNFAAETHVDRSILDPLVFTKTNVMGTQNLLEAALKNKVKRFHHVSTDEVFGALPLNSKLKFKENTIYDPHSPYSASKAASDHLVRSYFHSFGLPISITNASNNFGPYQDPEKFLPRMITNLILGEKVKIYGDGKYVRDWLYVEDHVRAIEKAIKKGRVGETYLVGGMTRDISNLDVATMLIKYFNRGKDQIEFIKDRPGHDRRYAVDWSKLKKELSWGPKFEFDKWLINTIEWYIDNQWWWKPLKNKSESVYRA